MKKLIQSLITGIIIFAVFNPPDALAKYSGGQGEPNNPYRLASKQDLLDLSYDVDDYNKCFVLTADIDMQGQVFSTALIAPDTIYPHFDFEAIPFTGSFDGTEHKIINLIINTNGWGYSYLGLFGYLQNAEIKNLRLENVSVTGGDYFPNAEGYYSNHLGSLAGYNFGGNISNCSAAGDVNGVTCIGGLVGTNNGNISDCCSTGTVACKVPFSSDAGGLVGYNKGSITGSFSSANAIAGNYSGNIGGLAGHNDGNIINCSATGNITGFSSLGGLVGSHNIDIISNSFATGNVTGPDYSGYLGGLVGGCNNATIINCHSLGNVIGGLDSEYLGGLVGENNDGDVKDCYSTGTVTGGYYSSSVGGLVGRNFSDGTITESFSTGDVTGDYASQRIGGLVGYNNAGIVSNCYSSSAVNGGYGSQYIGGLTGYNYNDASIAYCYAVGAVTGDEYTDYLGGLVGYNNIFGTITNSYSTGNVSGSEGSRWLGGIAGWNLGDIIDCNVLTDMQMRYKSSFIGWDFFGESGNGTNDYWRMCTDGVDYPHLTWEYIRLGDFTCPDGVDYDDLSLFSDDWLMIYPIELYGADTNGDKTVNFLDFAILAENWLESIIP